MSNNITQAAANKAAEEGGLPYIERFSMYHDHGSKDMMGDEDGEYVLYSHHIEAIAADRASHQVANVEVQTWMHRLGPDYNDSKEATSHEVAMEAEIAELREVLSRQVANKAEVEPVAIFQIWDAIPSMWSDVPQNEYDRWPHSERRIVYATPPATTGASTVLTDERAAFEKWARASCNMPDHMQMNWSALWVKTAWEGWQARAEVAAQAGQVAVPGWISVDDRLPELQKEVLICCGYLVLGYRTDDKHDPENHNGWVIDFDNGMASPITHWMPLPPSPTKESK